MNSTWTPKETEYEQPFLESSLCFLAHTGLFVALPQLEWLQKMIPLAFAQSVPEVKLQETLLQSYLFLGFPHTINALSAVQSLWTSPPKAYEPDLSQAEMQQRGTQLCQQIYGSAYPKLLQHMEKIHPDLKRYMIEEGYGKMLSRAIMTPLEREFGILPILLAQRVFKQLHSHLQGSLYLGATPQQLHALFLHLQKPLGEAFVRPAFDLLASLLKDKNLV